MSHELQSLKPHHRSVMRMLAQGIRLPDICKEYGLRLESWQVIVNSSLFQAELEQLSARLDEEMLKEAAEDPVRLKLKKLAAKAVETLAIEMDKSGDDSTASSRIRAADSILDRIGYGGQQKESAPAVHIHITAGKAQLLAELETAAGSQANGQSVTVPVS